MIVKDMFYPYPPMQEFRGEAYHSALSRADMKRLDHEKGKLVRRVQALQRTGEDVTRPYLALFRYELHRRAGNPPWKPAGILPGELAAWTVARQAKRLGCAPQDVPKYLNGETAETELIDSAFEEDLAAAACSLRTQQTPNVFRVDATLLRALAMTSASALKLSDIQMPYDGFVLELPQGFVSLTIGGQAAPLDALLISSGKLGYVAFVTTPTGVVIAETVGLRHLNIVAFFRAFNGSYQRVSWSLVCQEDTVLGQSEQVRQAERFAESAYFGGVRLLTPLDDTMTYTGMQFDGDLIPAKAVDGVLAALVCNVLIYLTCQKADILRQNRKGKLEEPNPDDPWPVHPLAPGETFHIGTRLKIDPELRPGRGGIGAGTGHQLTRPVVVTGFYRNQACGPGLSEHKRIWVMPFIRRPDLGMPDGHEYSVVPPK